MSPHDIIQPRGQKARGGAAGIGDRWNAGIAHLPSILAILLRIGRHVLFFQPSVHGHRLAQHILQLYLIYRWENSGCGHGPYGGASSVMSHDHARRKIIQISDRHFGSSRTIRMHEARGLPRLLAPPYLHRNHADQGKQRNCPNHNPEYLLSRHRIVRHEWRVIWVLGPSEEDTRRK